MSRDRSAPAFQFYARDFLSNANVQAMTLEERGAYIWLLSHCWVERCLPAEEARLARLCALSVVKFRRIWATLEPRFMKLPNGMYTHKRLDAERAKQDAYREKQASRGRHRWDAHPSDADTKNLLNEADQVLAEADKEVSRGLAAAKPALSRNDALRTAVFDLQTTSEDSPLPLSSPERIRWFDKLYRVYPNKDGKQQAEQAWRDLAPSEALAEEIVAIVQEKVKYGWVRLERRFIPMLKTFLQERRWEDEKTEVSPNPFGAHPHAWSCAVCGQIHEGPREKLGQCLNAKAS